ncbi:transcriptional repressor [Aquimarina sp. AD10]|uniref:Transcriptional regulator n=1 Tax=Aquimarina aggregata TaxID=1642818 RepID=A0A162CNV5_9FLAO|nr:MULTISPECIES: transcriptional repressor [Aquimarina]AXT62274.1 transcriptional repressor [Aquimarina sp. AD10]KZS39954.1 transcriptional regulator [Aquimarina aggregata]RKM90531.1 transcriptional repressor [Aquimarina sp. AD10]
MKRRNTQTKEAVLDLLRESGKAMSRDAIEQKIEQDINRATIYRVLNRFCEDGILHRVVAEDGKQYFAVCVNCDNKILSGPHFHFRCIKCDTIECLAVAVDFSVPNGYQVNDVNCVLSGTCKDCSC